MGRCIRLQWDGQCVVGRCNRIATRRCSTTFSVMSERHAPCRFSHCSSISGMHGIGVLIHVRTQVHIEYHRVASPLRKKDESHACKKGCIMQYLSPSIAFLHSSLLSSCTFSPRAHGGISFTHEIQSFVIPKTVYMTGGVRGIGKCLRRDASDPTHSFSRNKHRIIKSQVDVEAEPSMTLLQQVVAEKVHSGGSTDYEWHAIQRLDCPCT